MANISKQEARTTDLVKIKNERTGEILRVVSPHDLVVGIADFMESDLKVTGNSHITGSLHVKNGASGTLVLPDGSYALRGGASIQVVDDGDGGFTINSLAPGSIASAPKNAPFLTYQSSGDLSSEKVLNASGPITFDTSSATIGFDSSSSLTVSSLTANSITIGGSNLGSIPFILQSSHPAIPGAKSISSGDGVNVSTISSGLSVSVDASVARLSGAVFVGPVSATSVSSTNHNASNSTITSLNAPTISSTNITSTNVSSTKIISQKITGSLTKLQDGSDFLRAGTNVTILTGSDGSVTISAPAASGAPLAASYLLLSPDSTGMLSNERTLQLGQGLISSDLGPGLQYSVSVSDSQVAFLTGANFSGQISALEITSSGNIIAGSSVRSPAISGSLTRLLDGSPYLRAGEHVSISTGSDGSITINAQTGSFTSGPFILHQPDPNFPGSLSLIEGDGIQFDEDEHCGNLTITAKLAAGTGIELDVLPTREIVISSTAGELIASGSFIMASASSDYPSARSLTSSLGIIIDDNGPGASFDLIVDPTTVAFLTGAHFTGDVLFDGDVKFTGEVEFGDPKFYSAAYFYAGLSGSLTTLNDGTPYLVAGHGIGISTGSNGSITISNTGPEGDITEVIAGLGLIGGGISGSVSLSVDPDTIAFLTGSTFTGAVLFASGITGSLTQLYDGSPYLVAGQGINIETGSNGSVIITNDGTVGDITEVSAGLGLIGGGLSGSVSLSVDPMYVAFLTGSSFSGIVKFESGLSGSLTKLHDGSDYLVAGNNIEILTSSNGSVTISSTTSFSNLTGTDGIVVVSNGIHATASADPSIVAFLTGASFTGDVSFQENAFFSGSSYFESTYYNKQATFYAGLSGSLTSLSDGSTYLRAGAGIDIHTGSDGSITITNNGHVGDITGVIAGIGLLGGGASGSVEVYADENVLAFRSGTSFTGHVGFSEGITVLATSSFYSSIFNAPALFNSGLSGSLTSLADGSPYLNAGHGISITTSSNGSVKIESTITASVSVSGKARETYSVNGSIPAGYPVVFSTINFASASWDENLIEVYVNGQLQHSGTNITVPTGVGDYYLAGDKAIIFGFELEHEDLVDAVIQGGDSAPASILNEPFVTFAPSSNLLQSRIMKAGPGIEISTGSAGHVTISTNATGGNSSAFLARLAINEEPSGTINGTNSTFTVSRAPSDASQFMLWLNGQLLTQGPGFDYTLSGNYVTMLNDSVPVEDDLLVAMYPYVESSSRYVLNERVQMSVVSSTITGDLKSSPLEPGRVMLFWNGQLLTQGEDEDYIIIGKTIYINQIIDYLHEDDIFIACYTAQSESVFYEVNEKVTINYNPTLGLWTAELSHEPTPSSIMLFMNGQLLRSGPTNDFIMSGDQIVILDDDITGDFRFHATYQYT